MTLIRDSSCPVLPVQLPVVVSWTGLCDSKFSPVFPVNGSLRTAPRFPRSGPGIGLLARGRERDLPGFQAIHPVPLPRSATPAEPTIPRLLTVSSMLPPRFPRRRLQRLMSFGALSRAFGPCCLRFKTGVATIPARLTSGWLTRLYREGVEPSGSLQKVSDRSLILLFWT